MSLAYSITTPTIITPSLLRECIFEGPQPSPPISVPAHQALGILAPAPGVDNETFEGEWKHVDQEALKDLLSNHAPEIAKQLFAVQTLRLPQKGIAKIEGLVTPNLKQLNLGNNEIEKIENLDHLKALKWLDLSYNKISTIENLPRALETLSLSHNRISSLTPSCLPGTISALTLASNELSNFPTTIEILSTLPSLKIVTLSSNAWEYDVDWVIASLPELTFLDFDWVGPDRREKAKQRYEGRVQVLADKRETRERQEEEQKAHAAQRKKESEAHVPNISSLWLDLLERSSSHQNPLTGIFSRLLEPTFAAHKDEFQEAVGQLLDTAFEDHAKRRAELKLFHDRTGEGDLRVEHECMEMIRSFGKSRKASVGLRLGPLDKSDTSPSQDEELVLAVSALREKLIFQQVHLTDQMEGAVEVLRKVYGDLRTESIERAKRHFQKIRDLESQFVESIRIVISSATVEQVLKRTTTAASSNDGSGTAKESGEAQCDEEKIEMEIQDVSTQHLADAGTLWRC